MKILVVAVGIAAFGIALWIGGVNNLILSVAIGVLMGFIIHRYYRHKEKMQRQYIPVRYN